MSVQLTLLPFREGSTFSHMVLQADGAYDFFDAVSDVERRLGSRVPSTFNTYVSRTEDDTCPSGESHYGNTQDTPYGDVLRYVRLGDLLPLSKHPLFAESPYTRAAWAYLQELPGAWNVALYWH
jgi:hypothetical protein